MVFWEAGEPAIFLGYRAHHNPDKVKIERHTGIAEVRVRIPASLIFSGFLFATA